MQTLKWVGGALGGVLLGIAAMMVLLFLFTLWVYGVAWVSEKILWYVMTAAHITFWVCILILLPLTLFRVTRKVACFGLMGASLIFGATTWILGFLVSLDYWGIVGILIGLILGIVGVVPIGILAAMFHSDWYSVVGLVIGLVLTYGARAFSAWLAVKIDTYEEEKVRRGFEATAVIRYGQ
jgi:hypothetical protein